MLGIIPTVYVVPAAVLIVALLAPAAAAEKRPAPERERWHAVEEEVFDDYCGDLTVRRARDMRGFFRANARGRDQTLYGAFSAHGTLSITNLDTDRTMQLRVDFVDKDLKVTPNEDGTANIVVLHAGRWAWTAPDGVRLLDAGMVQFEVIYDYETGQDVFVRDIRMTGRWDTQDRDFCADVVEFIG